MVYSGTSPGDAKKVDAAADDNTGKQSKYRHISKVHPESHSRSKTGKGNFSGEKNSEKLILMKAVQMVVLEKQIVKETQIPVSKSKMKIELLRKNITKIAKENTLLYLKLKKKKNITNHFFQHRQHI